MSNQEQQVVPKEQYLRHLYYDPDSNVAFSSIANIWRKIKEDGVTIKYKELKEFLQEQPTYTLHKRELKKFQTRKVIVSYLDQQWQCDLVDMQKFSKTNKGYNYILTVIDILSRYAWAKPLKHKTGEEVVEQFKIIFKEASERSSGDEVTVPEKIQFDDGKEFYNKKIYALFDEHNIDHFSSRSEKKASIVERLNRTLKTRMWKYFTANETEIWYDVIDDLVNDYNISFHSSIGMTPTEARKEENSDTVWYNLYGDFLLHDFGKPKFKINDHVRISKYKTIFTKGYLPNYTEEIFKVNQVIYTKPFVYKLSDLMDEELDGYFYEQELSYVPNPDDIEYKIEKVIRRKTVKGKKMALVKWKGYSDKFNEWLPASEIKNL